MEKRRYNYLCVLVTLQLYNGVKAYFSPDHISFSDLPAQLQMSKAKCLRVDRCTDSITECLRS